MTEPQQGQRKKAIEDLCSYKVGILIQIIDELAAMDLSVNDIETILRTCGLNDECAIRFGKKMLANKEKGSPLSNWLIHP